MGLAERTGFAGFLWQACATGALAVSLQAAGPATAFDFREVRGIQEIFAALESAADPGFPTGSGGARLSSTGDGLPFWLVELDLAGTDEVLNLGLGKCWYHPARITQFAGFGATFPGLAALTPAEEEEPEGAPLTLGAWVGGGAYWQPSRSLRLGLGVKWTPGRLALEGSADSGGALEAVTALAVRW